MSQQPEGLDEANRLLRANLSPRARRLANFEAYVDGTQYDGRPDWFADDTRVSLFQRRPCVVYPIVRSAIDSNVDMLLGDGRFPSATTRPDENDEELLGESGTDEESSKTLDAFIASLHKASLFRAACREVFASAQAAGSAVAIFGARAGRPVIHTVKARWCEPEFNEFDEVVRLVIEYPYIETVKVRGAWQARARLYRRVVDAVNDTTFLPADARADGAQVDWQVDASKTIRHGLGFCPVVWYAHMRGCSVVGNYDGKPIHENILDEITAHDFALSMRHRAALFAGDPQWTETGVDQGHNPTAGGRRGGGIPSTSRGGAPSTDNPVNGSFREPDRGAKARRKGPGEVWQYDSPDVRVQLHTLPGDALKAVDENAHDLRQKIAESLCVVFMDPENVKFAATVSGKALETLKQRQLDRCDQYRSDFGEHYIVPATTMLLRMSARLGTGLRVPGIAKALPILKRFGSDVDALAAA